MGMGLGDNESLNFKLGGEQVDRLYLGSAYVWPNVPIANVVATDGLVGLVTVTWSDTNEVAPNTFDVYADGTKIASNVTSPYDYTIDESTKIYSVRGLYGGGHFIGSNEDSGTSLSGIVPGPITDFVASDTLYYEVQCHWSAVSGDPTPTYDLYENGGIVAQGVSSGHVQASAVGARPWHVVAVNAEGSTPSNTDTGTSLEPPIVIPPGEWVTGDPGDGIFTVPPDITTIVVHIIAAGGSGENTEVAGTWSSVGGRAGQEVHDTLSVSPGQQIAYTVGLGGASFDLGNDDNKAPGFGGGNTYFAAMGAAGGAGGTGDNYAGGESVTWENSSYNLIAFWGQPSSVGAGGNAIVGELPSGSRAGPGIHGSGGGGCCSTENDLAYNGNGGNGYIKVSWGG